MRPVSDRQNLHLIAVVTSALLGLVFAACTSSTPSETLLPSETGGRSLPATSVPSVPNAKSSIESTKSGAESPEEKVTGKPGSRTVKSPIGLAVFELAQRLGTSTESVVVLQVEEGLRVPSESPICADATREEINGSKPEQDSVEVTELLLAAAGREYTFRLRGWEAALCQPADTFGDIPSLPELGQMARPVALAMRELASHKDILPGQIQVHSVEAMEWPDSSLGCPEEGMMYAQVLTPGYRIILEAEGSMTVFHSDLERVVLCNAD